MNESLISMVLGIIVVLLVGLISYNYFRTHREVIPTISNSTITTPSKIEEQNPAVAVQKPQIGQAQNAVALPVTHTVAAGENLWTISERYYKSGYNFVDIAKINRLSNPGQLAVGQKLTIPNVEVKLPVTVANATAPIVTTSRITGNSYTVAKGDTIWEISVRAYGDGFKFEQIVKANGLINPNLIHSGNVLVIPR